MKFFSEKPDTPTKEKVLDIKTLLKLARQYIDDNNVKKAQQCCKKVLRKNSQNYMALILLGKSYGKCDDASSSYEKAIEIKPNQPLAWQGLAQHLEAKDEESAKIKLLNIYEKILTLDIEEEYAKKTLIKNGQLGCLLKNNDTISSFIKYIKNQTNENLVETAKTQLIQLLQSKITCKEDDIPDVIDILKNLDFKTLSEDHSEMILLSDLMLQNNIFVSAVEEILALPLFPESPAMKSWMCKLICEVFLSQNSFCGFDINKYINIIVTGIEDTKYGGILIAITYYIKTMFEEAYQKCISVIKEHFDVIEELEALFLLKCSKMTGNLLRTKNLCNYLLRKEYLYNPEFVLTMNAVLVSCYTEEKDCNKALCYLKKIPIDQIDSVVLSELGDLFLSSDVANDTTWELLDSTDYYDLFKALDFMKIKKFSNVIEILMAYDKHPIKYYFLALTYWCIRLNDESLVIFKKAAELLPNHPKVFYFLGIHYYRYKDEVEESRKCLEKAYALTKKDANIVKMLSIIYVRLGLVDLEFDLLQTAFDIPETCEYWVCIKLGRICFSRRKLDEALIYLQTVLNTHPRDVAALEGIGEIHFYKKEYEKAHMAYKKVLEISRNSVVFFNCLNRIGSIYSEKMLYLKAIFIFDKILDNDPGNVAALKGITENRIIFALKYVTNNLFQDAREQMQCAINRIIAAMSKGIKDLVYWLLYGDVLIFMTRLPNEHSFVYLQTSEGVKRKNKIDMYKMAIESYSNLIKFRDSSALFKCAIAYFEFYCETRNIAFCKTSYNLAVLYMKINPNVWPIWDLLGKICYQLHKCETAYYCFSKTLSLGEDSEFKVWFDLGMFYLKLNKHQLANYRHVIDRFDLNFAPTWIKEELSDTISNSSENSETADVGTTNVEDLDKLQFTEWIRTFNPSSTQPNEPSFDDPFEFLKRIPNANDIIEWYLHFEDETVWSFCTLGKLQERKGLFSPALRYYDRAYGLAKDKQKNEMLSHKGRVLMKMHEYEQAVNVYTGVRERDLHDTCALAHALYKIDNYKRSYASYDRALSDLCESDDQRVEVLIAMSNVAYRLNGLYEGAMLLLKAVNIKCGEGQGFNLPFLKSYIFRKVEIQLVAHVMSVYLHKHMDKTIWWYYMGLNYLRGVNKYAKLTRACIKRAIRVNTVSERNGKLYALICIAEFYAGNRQRALYYTTRALKLYPIQPELWATFILCIYKDKQWPRKKSFMRVVLNTVRKVVNVSTSLDKWLTEVEKNTMGAPKNFHFPYVPI